MSEALRTKLELDLAETVVRFCKVHPQLTAGEALRAVFNVWERASEKHLHKHFRPRLTKPWPWWWPGKPRN